MYKKYSDEELIEVYSSMIDYSGELSKEMLNEIESRGGLEIFKKKILKNNILAQEINRISKEVYSLTSNETNIEFIKKFITSDILTENELNELVEKKFFSYELINKNKTINSKIIFSSFVAAITASIVGAIIFTLLIIYLTPVFIYFIIPIYIINYLIISLITKKTRANLVVFIATFLATIGSIFLGLYFAGFLLPAL